MRIIIACEINYYNTQALDITGVRADSSNFEKKTAEGVP